MPEVIFNKKPEGSGNFTAEEKVTSLFQFIKGLNELKQKKVLNIKDYPWSQLLSELPDDPENIKISYRDCVLDEQAELWTEEPLLTVRKPEYQSCPKPDSILDNWLESGWNDWRKEVRVKESRDIEEFPVEAQQTELFPVSTLEEFGEAQQTALPELPVVECFADDVKRVQAYEVWSVQRTVWATKQRLYEKTRRLFTNLYGFYTDLQRDSETAEIVAANGFFRDRKRPEIQHPVLTKRVRLRFDASQNIIFVEDVDVQTELYESVFQETDGLNLEVLPMLRAELRRKDYHPMDRNDAPDFLERLAHHLSSNSVFSPDGIPENWKESNRFLFYFAPCFLIRRRLDGTIQAIQDIIDDIQEEKKIPAPILDLALVGKERSDISEDRQDETVEEQLAAVGGESVEIFLAKEANREQLEIAKRIERYNAVLVQGPPGTGKTHTIANLLGHFLAQGKRILVTSHTTKALNVLKEKVPLGLQNLCVAVTDDSLGDMEKSVDGISDYLSRTTSTQLKRELDELALVRKDVIYQLASARKKLYAVIQAERGCLVYQGEEISPSDAAKFVYKHAETLSYIPGQVRVPSPLPLSIEELRDLYRSNGDLSVEYEQELERDLPNPKTLMTPMEFEQLLNTLKYAQTCFGKVLSETGWRIEDRTEEHRIFFSGSFGEFDIPYPSEESLRKMKEYSKGIGHMERWMEQAAVDGKRGGAYRERWTRMAEQIQKTLSVSEAFLSESFGKDLRFVENISGEELASAFERLKSEFVQKGKISKFLTLTNKALNRAWKSVTINGKIAQSVADCNVILYWLKLQECRAVCSRYWKELMAANGLPAFEDLDASPELIANNYTSRIEETLNWYKTIYTPFLNSAKEMEIPLDTVIFSKALDSELVTMEKALQAVTAVIPHICNVCEAVLVASQCSDKLFAATDILKSGKRSLSSICLRILNAMESKDPHAYAQAYSELEYAFTLYSLRERRKALLDVLSPVAPLWAEAIRNRDGMHGNPVPPDSVEDAWKWKQLSATLQEMTRESFDDIQSRCLHLSHKYREKTAEYAEKSAWYYLHRAVDCNTTLQSNLVAWKQIIHRIGKGTGKRAPMLKARARAQMKECQEAVPAWIMPINRALESFNPKENRFDVVIIDEASQSNLSSLAILYMGKKLVIVGDSEQVSPLAVGLEIDKVESLQRMYLHGKFPKPEVLYEKTSIYDFAALSFQNMMLQEHFRCVPEIIGFSNMLSYRNKIKPLRDASSSCLLPAVVSYRVFDGERIDKRNPAEARAIAALIKACIKQPEYDSKTFGVISLLGDEQVREIQQWIFRHIDPVEIERRRILVGNASNFQGDERDVVFLSVVDSGKPQGGPIRFLGDGTEDAMKKRYNVAASRARDQLWVVHSLDAANDLKPDDLRKKLIDYAVNPSARKLLHEQIERAAESPFEEEVAKSLSDRGYHLVQQWEVGAYRIDMVAVCGKKTIAIECDGERYHSGEVQVRKDMERQTILERLGWRFIRIRGSEYFRNPKRTIEQVTRKLSEYGIEPEVSEAYSEAHENRNTELLRRVKAHAEIMIRNDFQEMTESEDEAVIESALNSHEWVALEYGASVSP